MNTSQETEEWDTEDDLPVADWLQSFSERGLEISETDLNSWYGGNTEEIEQIMTDEEICKEIQKYRNIGATNYYSDVVFNCFNSRITWAEENGVSGKDVIVLRNLQKKVLNKDYKLQKKTDFN